MNDPSFLGFLDYLRGHRDVLYALTAGVCVCAGIPLFLIWLRTLREQLWLLFLSAAYLLWAAQYLFRWVSVDQLGPLVCSILNNYFLIISAFFLLGWSRRHGFRRWLTVTGLTTLAVVLSKLAEEGPLARFPDSVSSVAALALLGFGLSGAIPLGSSRKTLQRMSKYTVIAYILLQLFYVVSPFVVGSRYEDGLDLLVFALALPLKLFIYLVAFYIVSRSIERLHPRSADRMGWRGAIGRPAASVSELTEHFGQLLDADVCEICLRLPGQREPQSLWRAAIKGGALEPGKEQKRASDLVKEQIKALKPVKEEIPDPENSYVGRVLSTGNSELEREIPAESTKYLERHKGLPRRQSILTVPIGRGNAASEPIGPPSTVGGSASRRPTIGALNVEWFEAIALTETMALQVQQMADQVAPYLEKERELAAIASLSQRVGFLESETHAPANAHEVIIKIIDDVHDLFAPNQTELRLKWGFDEATPIVVRKHDVPAVGPETTLAARLQLEVAAGWAHNLGTLSIVVPQAHAPIVNVDRPILGTSKFYRDLVASMVVDATLDAYRRSFGVRLQRVAVSVNALTVQSPDQWWRALNSAVAAEGLCWAAAKDRDSPALCPVDFAAKLQAPRLRTTWNGIEVITASDPLSMEGSPSAHSIVKLELPGVADGWLWIGIPRRGFGPELDEPPSPWRVFLEGIAATAGRALARIRSREQIDVLTREAMVAQSVLVGSTVLHDVMNHATSVVNNLHVFEHGLDSGQVTMESAHRTLLGSILEEANGLGEVMDALRQARGYDEERPTTLSKALTVVERLHHFRLEKQGFRFAQKLPPDLPQINAPLHVLTLVFSNLVGNSLDAKETFGTISISAQASPGGVTCTVQDDGPGLPVGREVFMAGRSTKVGGTGLGLWLSKRCLEDIGGQIVAGPRGGPGSRFTLHLPTVAKEHER